MEIPQELTRPTLDTISYADSTLIRRAAERLHRFDIETAAARLQIDPASLSGFYFESANTLTRRRLVRALIVVGGTA